ncbi:MAG: hypothetical protein ACFB2X_03630 [Rivularia sp. (in: cyanobacteria)]
MIDSQYRTIGNRNYRAIATLSMGCGQALEVGLNNLSRYVVKCFPKGRTFQDSEIE